ncbi:MAG: sugar phosphate isomerase/epimerase [Chitinophagaceae bacterium]|nr:sugar phosphate isomerase/epimerase [Anaerolineae bacterium]
MTTLSFMSANFVARQVDYNMTSGWTQGDNAANAYFRPIETYAERFDALLSEITTMGFSKIDIWNAHLHWSWATPEHIAIAKDLLAQHNLTVASMAGGFGDSAEDVEKACKVAVAMGTTILGGNTSLRETDRPALVALLKHYGVKLGIENHPEKTAQELLDKIADGSDGTIGAAVDTGWFGTHGYDAAKALEEVSDYLIHVHLKDVLAAGEHKTCGYGLGVVPIEACVQTLQKIGYTGAISVEHEPEHGDPTEAIKAGYTMLKGWLNV